jgi:glycosyltransferase involved in cell wall biosynthesis
MTINYIANLRLPTERAYGIQIAKTCEALALLGNDVRLFYPHRKNQIKEGIFKYYSVKENFVTEKIYSPDFYLPGFLDKYVVMLKNLISAYILALRVRKRPGIIYSRDELPIYILSFFRDPASLAFEAHKFSNPRKLFYERFKRKGIKVVTISNGLKKEFLNLGFKDILVAPDGVDLKEFEILETKEECRNMFDLPLDKTIVMYSGHFYDWKGVRTLVDAYKMLPADLVLVMVGGKKEGLGIISGRRSIKFIERLPHSEIPKVLKAADILVLPNSGLTDISRYYTSPLKLFEYMASGRPIVASDLPSIREILNENNAWFFEADNEKSLAESITRLLEDERVGDSIAAQALKDASKYSWINRSQLILDKIKN